MKNIEQIVKCPVWMVSKGDMPPDVRTKTAELAGLEARRVMLLKSQKESSSEEEAATISKELASTVEKISTAKEILDEKVPEEHKAFMKHMWVDYPHEVLELRLKLGHVLFELYEKGTPKPDAPILLRSYNKRMQELADVLNSDEFEIPDDVKSAALDIMSDNDKWKSFGASAYVQKIHEDDKKEVRSISINHKGVEFFDKVLNELTNILVGDETKEGKLDG